MRVADVRSPTQPPWRSACSATPQMSSNRELRLRLVESSREVDEKTSVGAQARTSGITVVSAHGESAARAHLLGIETDVSVLDISLPARPFVVPPEPEESRPPPAVEPPISAT